MVSWASRRHQKLLPGRGFEPIWLCWQNGQNVPVVAVHFGAFSSSCFCRSNYRFQPGCKNPWFNMTSWGRLEDEPYYDSPKKKGPKKKRPPPPPPPFVPASCNGSPTALHVVSRLPWSGDRTKGLTRRLKSPQAQLTFSPPFVWVKSTPVQIQQKMLPL